MTLRKKKMDSDMQKLPLMSHGGPGHAPHAGLYWYNLVAGRPAGLCPPASLAYRRCTSFGIEIWTINHVLSSFACLLVCGLHGLLLLTKPVKARRRGGGRRRRPCGQPPSDCSGLCHDNMPCTAVLR